MIMDDNITVKSRISCDPEGRRAYLMSLDPDDFPFIIKYLDKLAESNGYTKLFVKVQPRYAPAFLQSAYQLEAFVPCFYRGIEDAFFLAKYFDKVRSRPEKDALLSFLQILQGHPVEKTSLLDQVYSLRQLTARDSLEMTEVFGKVIASYPFPIFDTNFLMQTMQEGTRYYGIFDDKKLVAISSAECEDKNKCAEMTDFAVLPDYRGKGFALILLRAMENDLLESGYLCLYTIARLHALSMNKTFFNAGYQYSGTMHNNTQIAGRIESMNVWYKLINQT